MAKSTLFLILVLAITSLNCHQIFQFVRHGDTYALNLECNEDGSAEATFLLNLYSSKSVLGGQKKCLSFTSYQDKDIAVPYPSNEKGNEVSTPFAMVSGSKDTISCSLIRKAEKKSFNVVVPDTCTSSCNAFTNSTKGNVGMLGMTASLNNDALTSRFSSFGIHIPDSSDPEQKGDRGFLVTDIDFKDDYYETGTPNEIPASTDFQMEFVNELYFGANKELLSVEKDDIKVSFDINYGYIGLPGVVYDKVLELFKRKGLECSNDNVCTYSGNIEDLPYIGIGFAYGPKSLLSIDYNQYLDMNVYKETKQLRLKIRKLVNLNEGFESTIVLGRAFMEKRYITFDYKDLLNVKVRIYGKNPHMKYVANEIKNEAKEIKDEAKVINSEHKEIHTGNLKGSGLGHEQGLMPKDDNGKSHLGYYFLAAIIGGGFLAALFVAYRNRNKKEEQLIVSDPHRYHEMVSPPQIPEL